MNTQTLKEIMGAEAEAARILKDAEKEKAKLISNAHKSATKLLTDFEADAADRTSASREETQTHIAAEKTKLAAHGQKELEDIERKVKNKEAAVRLVLKEFESLVS